MFVNLLVGGLAVGGIYGLIALGYSLIYRASGLMSFCQGDLLMIGAFFGITFLRVVGVNYYLSMLIVLVLMFAMGMLLERFAVRPVLLKGGKSVNVVLITIGISIVLQNGAVLVFGPDIKMFPSLFKTLGVKVGRYTITPESILIFVVGLILMLCLHLFMTKTRLGTAMRAATQNEKAANAYGINVSLMKGLTWALATALASVAGMLYAPTYGVHSGMGAAIGLKGFSAAVIGGFGDMYGAIVGGLTLGLVETFAGGYISSQAKDLVSFAVLIIFLIIKPRGLFNVKLIDD